MKMYDDYYSDIRIKFTELEKHCFQKSCLEIILGLCWNSACLSQGSTGTEEFKWATYSSEKVNEERLSSQQREQQ